MWPEGSYRAEYPPLPAKDKGHSEGDDATIHCGVKTSEGMQWGAMYASGKGGIMSMNDGIKKITEEREVTPATMNPTPLPNLLHLTPPYSSLPVQNTIPHPTPNRHRPQRPPYRNTSIHSGAPNPPAPSYLEKLFDSVQCF